MKLLWCLLAYAGCVAGFTWLALAMEPHGRQVRPAGPLPPPRLLRSLGVVALLLSLLACLRADHPTMAALVWVMTLAAAALTVTFTLSWRPWLLRPLAFWPLAAAGNVAEKG
ncbi:DUF3325 domain-containing protein [Aquabacterium sp. OR-4]|uniref:DUF3325 domain-containing protein n=1 Tax=Aquabacterium sp. OR-4 TaxID=2978127 RepID=UPI0021B17FD4|nr:DUF3325 domain-containing protein [Aquabacterium sp. OR-4]MDT7838636.1 DUF3325 domain-containing protein [Aquabacterium sp. OR-4]